MVATQRLMLLVGVTCTVACTSSNVGGPDAPPTPSDGIGNEQGLVVPFTSKSPIPGDAKSNIHVSRALFRLAYLRVIGDAGPGDTRTSRNHFNLEWNDGTSPSPVAFADAPAGLYSKVSIRADGETISASYEFDGSVKLKGDDVAFRIHDLEPLEIAMDTDVALDPGKTASVQVRLELESVFDELDFEELPVDQGVRVLATTDPQMPQFRNQLKSSFVAIRGKR